MNLNIIVAIGNNWQIGLNNKLPWNLKGDMAHFKSITSGNTVIMGRKTFDSIGKPLPNRKNIVVSKNKNFFEEGYFVANSIESALNLSKNDKEVFICGGEEVYREIIKNYKVDKIYLTIVDYDGEADSFFPKFDFNKWLTLKEEKHLKDENNEYDYKIVELKRK